jgi:ATP-dependent DNA helicase RecG
MSIPIVEISQAERDKILALRESHFCDLKATPIKPAKLTRSMAALSNAEGGELYLGIEEDKTTRENTWNGFNVPEDANGHL